MIPVIIPAYQNSDQLEKCIKHLKNQTAAVEIFVRDNSADNVYFTAAINQGIEKFLNEPCEYIIILNQDMYLKPDAVEKMVTFMDSNPQCGIGTPLQLHSEDPAYVICAGCFEAFPAGRHQHGPLTQFTDNQQIPWGNGACMILRKQMIRQIGLMDNNFVFIGSDSDYCFTARSRGWQVWSIASARGVHDHGASGAEASAQIRALKVKDMIYFGKKWLTGQLYGELAYEKHSPESVDDLMNQLRQAQNALNSLTVSG